MAFFRYLIPVLVLALTACAEVGRLSGGPEDTVAPRPQMDKAEPPNGSVSFQGKEVAIPFDEFFKVYEPNINIRMVPPHASVATRVKGKTLYLSWEESLQPNTTYAIYLNNAVRDITESNDSIIQYVFSTGPVIDTLSHTVAVADAWTGEPVNECTVGLFDPESGQLQSFSETNKKGMAELKYLREGNYSLVAFIDQNKDLEIQAHESLAFPSDATIQIDPSASDTTALRLFSPVKEPSLRTVNPVFPGVLILGATQGLEGAEIFVDGVLQQEDRVKVLGPDSLMTFIRVTEDNTPEIIVQSDSLQDTLKVRVLKNDRTRSISLKPKNGNGKFDPLDSLIFTCNDFIESVDTNLFKVLNASDSAAIPYSVSFEYNELHFAFPDRNDITSVLLTIKQGGVKTTHGRNTMLTTTVSLPPARKYGTMVIDASYYQQPVVILVWKGERIVREIPLSVGKSGIRAESLEPGDYWFTVVRDENGNGRWDVGDYTTRRQPEMIDRYSTTTKVRANWEIELSLFPNQEE